MNSALNSSEWQRGSIPGKLQTPPARLLPLCSKLCRHVQQTLLQQHADGWMYQSQSGTTHKCDHVVTASVLQVVLGPAPLVPLRLLLLLTLQMTRMTWLIWLMTLSCMHTCRYVDVHTATAAGPTAGLTGMRNWSGVSCGNASVLGVLAELHATTANAASGLGDQRAAKCLPQTGFCCWR